MVNHKKTIRFLNLLVQQDSGDASVGDEIRSLGIIQDDGQCLFDLYEEWMGAFSFAPGRLDALEPLLALTKWLTVKKRDNVYQIHDQTEWATLVAIRGPVESVIIKKCMECDLEAVCIGTSGFYEANCLICSECGNVYFKSYYDESELPRCNCGGQYTLPHPGCMIKGHRSIFSEISPYEYFANHSLIRGNGA